MTEDDPFARAYERAAYAEPRARHDHSYPAQERARIASIIAGARADRDREQVRREANVRVANGDFTSLPDTVIEPTPEWLGKGPVRTFTAKLRDDQVQSVKTVRSVRRVLIPVVVRLRRQDKLTGEQLSACMWYREQHEVAGLEGHYSSSRYSDEPGHGSTGAAAGHMAMTVAEAQARALFRKAQASISAKYLKFLEKVVLCDMSPRRAAGYAMAPYRRVNYYLREAANELVVFCRDAGIELREVWD